MTGRGIDQIQLHRSDPTLHEEVMTSAEGYVRLAERRNGPIPRGVRPDYVWGDLLFALARRCTDLRFANLETAVTECNRAESKGINYRMHPRNIGVLTALGLDGVSLANNHVMDWSTDGLSDTCQVLRQAGIGYAGAGLTHDEAALPLTLPCLGAELTIVSLALTDSGVPRSWRPGTATPGVALIEPDVDAAVDAVRRAVPDRSALGGPLLVSIHWGSNWGYGIDDMHRAIAHALVDRASVDIIHGHSSHHPRAVEIYKGRAVFYGCGDLLNDYEGIRGQDRFRNDLVLAYILDVNPGTGQMTGLEMLPMRLRRFRLERAARDDAEWLLSTMRRECAGFGGDVVPSHDDTLRLIVPE